MPYPKLVSVDSLKPLARDAPQIRKLGESLQAFGFVVPIVIDAEMRVVAGWGLVLAARKIGLPEVPAVTISDCTKGRCENASLGAQSVGRKFSWTPRR